MKRLLLTSASLLALLAATPTASATTFLFSGAIVDFTVPVAGTYQITAFGAQGGSSGTGVDLVRGGGGAEIRGDFVLAKGGVLEIAVGGMGGSPPSSSGGGGGGSFVIGPGNNPLVIAGGGGGAGGGDLNVAHEGGYGGLASTDGGDGFGTLIHRGVGGSSGAGGSGGGYGGGGGGGGFKSSGSDGKTSGGGGAGGLLGLNGGAGNSGGGNGGFGAGGGGGVTNVAPSYNIGGGGGGGGYSGGGGGQGAYNNLLYYGGGGGGGGSFDGGTNQFLQGNIHAGNGEVLITEIGGSGGPAVPEPSTWMTMATGFAALGLAGLRRRRKA
jgi:hypothetical protein